MRKRNNIFFGDSYYALFATKTYNRLISRKWFTYADVMADFMNLNSANELPCNVSKCDQYGELKKAFPDVLDVIKDKLGNNCIEESGNNRNKRYRYIGNDKDPLADMRNAKVVNDLKQYWQFCQDSAGFFPTSWIEYFFNGCQDILDIKNRRQKGEQVLSSSLDRVLTNIEFLPFLYECIKNKNVLSVQYKPFEDELQEFTFHPHLLKEYNGRWFLFGHAEGQTPEFGYNLALDRIAKRPNKLSIRTYISAPKNFYNDFFKSLLFQYKGQYDYVLKDVFLSLFIRELKERYKDYIIVVAPSSFIDNQKRGFAPMEEIGKTIHSNLFLNLYKKEHYKQSDLSFEERKNVKDRIGIENGEILKGRKILIIDDVFTSGSTLHACLNLTLTYSPKHVELLVLSTGRNFD